MGTLNLRRIYGQLNTADQAAVELFEALIDEISSLQGRVELLESKIEENK